MYCRWVPTAWHKLLLSPSQQKFHTTENQLYLGATGAKSYEQHDTK